MQKRISCGEVELRYDSVTPWGLAIEERRLSITSRDNAFVTNIMLLLSLRFRTNKTLCCRYVALKLSRKRHLLARDDGASEAAHRTPQGGTQSERK